MLAAAMWSNPHMLIMDEPTNYLDRDSLGALAEAIKDWNGEGVEGVDACHMWAEHLELECSRRWHMR